MKKILIILGVLGMLSVVLIILSTIFLKEAPAFFIDVQDIETKNPIQNVSVVISPKPPYPDKCEGKGFIGVPGGAYSCPGRGDAILRKKTNNMGRVEFRRTEFADEVDEIAVEIQYSSNNGGGSDIYDLFLQDADFKFSLDRQSKKPLSASKLDGIGGVKVSSKKLVYLKKIDTSIPIPIIQMEIGKAISLLIEDKAQVPETVIHIKSDEADAKNCLNSGRTEMKDKMIYTHIQSNRCTTSHTISRLLPENDYTWIINYGELSATYTIRVFRDYMAIINEKNLFTKIPDTIDRSGQRYVITIKKDDTAVPYMEIENKNELEFVCPLSTNVNYGYSDKVDVWVYVEKSSQGNSQCRRKNESINDYDSTWVALPNLANKNYLDFYGHGLQEKYKINRLNDGRISLTREEKNDQQQGLKNNERNLEIKSFIPEIIIEDAEVTNLK